jgi:CRP-like cAMP-binding protein
MSKGFVGVAQKLGDAIGMVDSAPMHLANLFAAGRLAVHDIGDVLCTTDEPSDVVFLLASGTIEVSKPDRTGTPRPIAVLSGPAMLGHMGVIDGSPRSATCVVAGDAPATVIHLKADVFRRLIHRPDPTGSATRHLVLASLIRQLGNTNRTVSALIDGRSESDAAQPTDEQAEELDSRDLDLLQAVLRGWTVPPDAER